MKFCPVCSQTKSVSDFNRNKSKKDGLQTRCRDCQKRQNNDGYRNNPSRRDSIKADRDRAKLVNREYIKDVKSKHGCYFCDESEPVALDFHHKDPSEKDMNISVMVGYPIRKLKAEIEKCAVVCANCHRKLHAGIIKDPFV